MKIIENIMFDHFRFVNRIDQYTVKQSISMQLINNRKKNGKLPTHLFIINRGKISSAHILNLGQIVYFVGIKSLYVQTVFFSRSLLPFETENYLKGKHWQHLHKWKLLDFLGGNIQLTFTWIVLAAITLKPLHSNIAM